MQALTNTWVYLAQTPLLWLTITLIVYQLSALLYRRLNSPTILNPIITSIVVLVTLLLAAGTPYETYFEGAQFVHFLLGPATAGMRSFDGLSVQKASFVSAAGTSLKMKC